MQIDKLIKYFKSNKVKITKLNHSIDKSVQRATQYEGYIVLHENDGFDIMLKKPCGDHQYILEADPNLIQAEQNRYENQKKEIMLEHMINNQKSSGNRIPSFMLDKTYD